MREFRSREDYELDPKNSLAYYNRGIFYYHKEQYDQALADFNKAIELDSKNSWAYNNRGLVYYDKEQYDRALADFNKAIELDPKNSLAYYSRGLVYKVKEQYDQALADFNKAIKLNPDDDTRKRLEENINELSKESHRYKKNHSDKTSRKRAKV